MTDTDKHLARFSAKKKRNGEMIKVSIKGYMPGKKKNSADALMTGRLILTDQRICFYRKGVIGEKFESIDLQRISSLETKSLLGHKTLILYTTNNELIFKTFEKPDVFDPFVEQVQSALDTGSPTNGRAQSSASEPIAMLEKLAALHESGILSAEEFSAKKADILAQM